MYKEVNMMRRRIRYIATLKQKSRLQQYVTVIILPSKMKEAMFAEQKSIS
jgi:RNase P protein component